MYLWFIQKHILTLIKTDNDEINAYNDIKILIFQSVNKRYLQLQNHKLIYICLRAIADCNIIIMNIIKNDNNNDEVYWDDTLNLGEIKKKWNKRNFNEQTKDDFIFH